MISLVWRTDAHLADQPPQSRVDNWADTILGKLIQVGEVASRTCASVVLDGGDLFHIKSPSRTSHELMQRVTEIHRSYPCPILGNVGNHDVKYGDLQFLSEAPLGVLFKSRVIQPCYDGMEYYLGGHGPNNANVKLYPYDRLGKGWLDGSPFVSRHPLVPIVRVVGVPFHGTKYDFNRFTAITKGEEDFLVVMVHCLASERGGTMFEAEDIIRYGDLSHLDPDVWLFGHWHKDQGVKQIADGKWVINTGSLSRGSLSQDDLGRTPSCVILRFEEGKVTHEVVPLKVAPSSEVFDLVGRTRQDARKMTVDALVDSLHTALLTRQVESLLDELRVLPDVPEAVRERTLAYLERAGAK